MLCLPVSYFLSLANSLLQFLSDVRLATLTARCSCLTKIGLTDIKKKSCVTLNSSWNKDISMDSFYLPSHWEIATTVSASLDQDLEGTYWRQRSSSSNPNLRMPGAFLSHWCDKMPWQKSSYEKKCFFSITIQGYRLSRWGSLGV